MPPDRFVFDLNAAYPNVALDTMRLAMVRALADLADHLEQLADSFLLGQTAADFAQTVLVNFGTLQTAVAGQGAQIADLTDRVLTLEGLVADLQTQVAALQPPPTTAP